MKLPKVREIGEALKSLFSKPFTADFPRVDTKVPDGYRGKPQFYQDDCVGCLACLEVCPPRAIEYKDDKDKKERTLTHHPDICVYCQQCQNACITSKGILLTKQYNMATYDRRTEGVSHAVKKLVICDHCGEVVAPLDQLKFLARKVGHLAYTNPTLLLARHIELKLIDEEIRSDSPNKRAGHLRMICPNCRREMIVKEQW